MIFQSTPSVWRETRASFISSGCTFNFNPLPPCGGRPAQTVSINKNYDISIHSLRVEGDESIIYKLRLYFQFQSTPSVWRETFIASQRLASMFNFNPLPPCGGRLFTGVTYDIDEYISIHSLRVEGDILLYIFKKISIISIHSLRVEGDRLYLFSCDFLPNYFNPLPPCGGRQRRVLQTSIR